jgi:hypothetical protein
LGVGETVGLGVGEAVGLGVGEAVGRGVAVAIGFAVVVVPVVVVAEVVGLTVVVDPAAVGFAVGVDDVDEGDVVRGGVTCVPVVVGPDDVVVAPGVGDKVTSGVGVDDGATGDGASGVGVAGSSVVPLDVVPLVSLLPDEPDDSDGSRRQATVKAATQNRIMDMANSRTARWFGERRARDRRFC